MADTLQSRNSSAVRNLRDRLTAWDAKTDAKAPLTDRQKDGFIELTTLSANRPLPLELPVDDSSALLPHPTVASSVNKDDDLWSMSLASQKVDRVETAQQLFSWFSDIESQMEEEGEQPQKEFLSRLHQYQLECERVVEEVEQCLEFLTVLKTDYVRVATKTNALHEACENLLEDQTQLVNAAENINSQLSYFNELDRISTKLNSPTFSVTSESFLPLLTQLDDCIEYLNKHAQYRESNVYLAKFRHCLSRALSLLKAHVFNILHQSTQQVLPAKEIVGPLDDAFTLFYGKFRTNAPRIKSLVEQVERRVDKSPEYAQLLSDCHHCYLQQRLTLLSASVSSAINDLVSRHSRDHCALVRSGCAFMIHICEDEHQLFFHFFTSSTPLLNQTLENLCTNLYDALRPLIIHINHLETLSELCSILKVEMMEEHIQNNSVQLAAFDVICAQMLQDVQERLVFRTHIYIRQEILNYNPASGDLAYPSKLEMMESIAEKLRAEHAQRQKMSTAVGFFRQNSTSSIQSVTSIEVAEITQTARNAEAQIAELASHSTDEDNARLVASSPQPSNNNASVNDTEHAVVSTPDGSIRPVAPFITIPHEAGSNMPMSPADLHGMWYPTVRRTLVCMSKLYRCIDKATFQGLSQETLSLCIQSLIRASDIISKNQMPLDGQLFLIKHLLILREQIAPFHIDFAVKEMALDFSKLKNAAFELLRARSKLFAFNSNNAVLQFLLDGTPAVMETYVDSKKEVDSHLKRTCEDFIRNITQMFVGSLTDFLTKAKVIAEMTEGTGHVVLRQQPFASAEKLRDIVADTYRQLKQRHVDIQRKMSLYLANSDTEFILFKPMKANVIQRFQQLHRLLDEHYTDEDQLIIAAPTTEQVSLLLTAVHSRPTTTTTTTTAAAVTTTATTTITASTTTTVH